MTARGLQLILGSFNSFEKQIGSGAVVRSLAGVLYAGFVLPLCSRLRATIARRYSPYKFPVKIASKSCIAQDLFSATFTLTGFIEAKPLAG